jgi:predicted DNA-binding transcriptional regulator AlpA
MPTQLENTKWYTIQEVATILGKSEGTIYNRVKAGLIPLAIPVILFKWFHMIIMK